MLEVEKVLADHGLKANFGRKKAFRRLIELLERDSAPETFLAGTGCQVATGAVKYQGYVVLTDRRVAVAGCGTVLEVYRVSPLGELTEVTLDRGRVLASLELKALEWEFTIQGLTEDQIRAVYAPLIRAREDVEVDLAVEIAAEGARLGAVPPPSMTSELSELASLFERGLLSEAEYTAAKNRILGRAANPNRGAGQQAVQNEATATNANVPMTTNEPWTCRCGTQNNASAASCDNCFEPRAR